MSPELNNRAFNRTPLDVSDPNLKEIGKRKHILILDSVIDWSLTAGPVPYIEMGDTDLGWSMPIKVGDSLTASLPLYISGVGEFNLILMERDLVKDFLEFHVTIVIDELGQTFYVGKYPPPHSNPLGAHPYSFGEELEMNLIGKKMPKGDGLLEPFDINILIDPVLKVGQSSRIACSMAAMSSEIEEIQYEIVRATNLKIDKIPSSQDVNPGEGMRFETSFNITPQAEGRSFLSFEVIGHPAGSKAGIVISSKMGYHLIFGEDGDLLYIGKFDPFAAGFRPGNPAYARIDGIMDFDSMLYGLKTERSLPDFLAQRKSEERIQDSIRRAKLSDSLEVIDKE